MPLSDLLCFEDFQPGDRLAYGDRLLTREEVVGFAQAWDPQPMHLDEAAGEASALGGLAASGWHACALLMRLICEGFLLRSASLGAPGVEGVRWLRPLRPGVRLSARHEVLGVSAPRSRPDRGFVRFRLELLADGVPVMEQVNPIMLARRGAPPAPPGPPPGPPAAPPGPPPPPPVGLPYLEDLVVGAVTDLGGRPFTADEVLAFARAHDPQPFHLDEAAARATHFGALSASGWHTAAGWMRAWVDHQRAAGAAARAAGRPSARPGPSPGFRDLRWHRPVRAGDAVTYRTTVAEARPSASRPGWGVVTSRNEGFNQRGEPVLSFLGAALLERRPG